MYESTNREKVLKKIRASLLHKTNSLYPNLDFDKQIFTSTDLPAELVFAEVFESNGGKLIICENRDEIIETLVAVCKENKWNDVFCVDKNLSELLDEVNFSHQSIFDASEDKNIEAAIVTAEALIAKTGVTVFSSASPDGRMLPALAKNLVVIATSEKIVDDLKFFLLNSKSKYNGNQPSAFYFLSPAATILNAPFGEALPSLSLETLYVVMVMGESNEDDKNIVE
jgi:L-lactate dehydrogenase complex protein LldG